MKEPGLSKPCKLPGPLACFLHHCQTRLSEDRESCNRQVLSRARSARMPFGAEAPMSDSHRSASCKTSTEVSEQQVTRHYDVLGRSKRTASEHKPGGRCS